MGANNNLRVVIAGGGTGGHVFPMIAVARAIEEMEPESEIIFIGTNRGIESRLVPKAGFTLKTLKIGGLKGKSIFRRAVTLAQLPIAMLHSAFLTAKFGPHVVLGGGGYASGPVGLVASLQRIPLALLEVNSIPGLTNRKLAKRADAVFLAFEATQKLLAGCRSIVTGNPVRSGFRIPPDRTTRQGRPFHLLIVGGSQGAVAINSLVIDSLNLLKEMDISITHQTGSVDVERVRSAYAEAGVTAGIEVFIEDMTAAYTNADLVVCRAGATTVAELIAARKPAVLIPLPTAADNHQEHNARVIVDAGGGQLLRQAEADGTILADSIANWYHHREKLEQAGDSLADLDRPDAAEKIAEELITLARGQR